jgi:hypothetical protein
MRRRERPVLIDEELADQLLGKAQAEGVELLGPDGLLSQVTKAVLERALAEEMTAHLGYEKHDPAGRGSGNSRNGTAGKRLLTRRRRGGSGGAAGPGRQLRPQDRAEGPDPVRAENLDHGLTSWVALRASGRDDRRSCACVFAAGPDLATLADHQALARPRNIRVTF